ncbi:hypothetical protein SO802_017633 [Lithocarpus litseifolius]|uniref:Uncharacterized protein n=1 Tax=Lithocarpus litseifolius TaxID=425828 RepID=A0AAW2CIL4_9ROSI
MATPIDDETAQKILEEQNNVLKEMGRHLTRLEDARLKKTAHVEIHDDEEGEGWDKRDKANYERNKKFEKLTADTVAMKEKQTLHAFPLSLMRAQFIFNTMIDVTLVDLETTKQGVGKSFSEYMIRWKGKASRMVRRPNEKDQINMIIKNLIPTYSSRLLSLPISSFGELCECGTRIEDAINNGKLEKSESKPQIKKTYRGGLTTSKAPNLGILMASHKHRSVLSNALSGKEVPIETTLQEVLSWELKPHLIPSLSFLTKNYLLTEPLTLDLCKSPSSAQDNTSWKVIGTFKAPCKFGLLETIVEFHVMDITPNYNILLGKACLHPIGVIPSSLHQKLKIPWKRGITVVIGDGEILAHVCGLEEGGSELQMNGFDFVNMANYGLKDKRYTMDLLSYCSHEEGVDFPFCGFPEFWVGEDGKVYHGWEIFFDEKLTSKKNSTMVTKEFKEKVN